MKNTDWTGILSESVDGDTNGEDMKHRGPEDEPMCETSEKGEKLFSRGEMLPIALDIGRRILEVFGYQKISNITFRLKSSAREINAVINGEKLPSTELLLGIQIQTGASIDWLLTGIGPKYLTRPEITAQPNTSLGTKGGRSESIRVTVSDALKQAHLDDGGAETR